MTTRAKELFEASVDQVRRGDVRAALGSLLDALGAEPVHGPSLEAAARICRMLGAAEDARLFEQVARTPDDPEPLFALGWRLVDQDRPDVAVGLLRRALKGSLGLPQEAGLRRELAFAQLQARDFAGCLTTISPLADDADLPDAEALDVRLLAAEAALYAGRRELCQEHLQAADELVPDDVQRARLDALHELLGRSASWSRLAGLGLREWHFIQHAGVILKVAGGWFEDGSRQGRYDVLDLREDMVAFLLQRLLDLLEDLELPHDVVVPASETAAPLAAALARAGGLRLGRDLDEPGRVLLVAASASELQPLARRLSRHRSDLTVFALNLDWTREAPVMPEVAGVLARRVFLPWEARFALDPSSGAMREEAGDGRDAAELGASLVAAMAALPDDGGAARREFLAFYEPLKDDLVLGNESRHPHRRVFTPLSPCWAASEAGTVDDPLQA